MKTDSSRRLCGLLHQLVQDLHTAAGPPTYASYHSAGPISLPLVAKTYKPFQEYTRVVTAEAVFGEFAPFQ
jgi:hypothetical protein